MIQIIVHVRQIAYHATSAFIKALADGMALLRHIVSMFFFETFSHAVALFEHTVGFKHAIDEFLPNIFT